MKRAGLAVLLVVASLTVVPRAAAHAEPVFDSATYFGGAGDERGTGLAISGSDLYVAGSSGAPWPTKALLLRYSIPLLALAWDASSEGDGFFTGVAPSADIVYAVGAAVPPACGASDGVGGTEGKSVLAWYSPSGALLGCHSPNFFSYRGCEQYGSAFWDVYGGASPVIVVQAESAVYAAGSAQANWSNWTAVLAKYDSTGTLLWWRSVGDTGWLRYSDASALAWLDGYVYVAGRTAEGQAALWKYDSAGTRMWVKSFQPGANASANCVAAAGGYLYLAGRRWNGANGNHDVLLLKYDENGILQWNSEWGGVADDIGYGIAVSGDRLYVVGGTSSFGAGGKDAFLLEVDPADGTVLSSSLWGGAADDMARHVAVTGSDIYVAGQTASFGAGGDDLVLLRFTTAVNHPPIITAIAAPVEPVQINTSVDVSATFSDPDVLDTHTAVWDWGDDSTSPGTVSESNGSGSVTDDHTYTGPGVYTLKLTVTDDHGDSGESVFEYVVIYNADGGFVTGGGWIMSPEGAYAADPSLTGKANFGFVAKYKKGANTPSGKTEFQFRVADLNFHSTEYQWLVIAGVKAKYKGTGTINSAGDYGFMLCAIDGDLKEPTGSDRFRIKIWDKDADDAVVYDNQMGKADDSHAATEIQGGSIVIHKQKEKGGGAASISSAVATETGLGAQIVFTLSAEATVSVSVLNIAGRTIRQVVADRAAEAGINTVLWDARSDRGAKVPAGMYLVQITCNASDGTRTSRIVALQMKR